MEIYRQSGAKESKHNLNVYNFITYLLSILLDYHSVAKLTDFGITARIKPDEIDVSCTKVWWSFVTRLTPTFFPTIYWHKAPEQIDCENLDSERLKNVCN